MLLQEIGVTTENTRWLRCNLHGGCVKQLHFQPTACVGCLRGEAARHSFAPVPSDGVSNAPPSTGE